MAETTGIAWTDSTFNPWMGCAKVSPGCDNCYAEVSTPARTMGIVWGPNGERKRTSEGNWNLPRRWNAGHAEFFAKHGRRRRVFCASLADVFDNQVNAQWRIDLLKLISETPNLDWLILTKRIGNAAPMLESSMRAITHGREGWADNYFPNVWLGISVVNQEEADRDIPKLIATPANVRWLSMEPLLGPVDLTGWHLSDKCGGEYPFKSLPVAQRTTRLDMLDWVVVGGESGANARPMQAEWVGQIRQDCDDAKVAFFFKQWGGVAKDKGGCQLVGQEAKAWPVAV